LALNPEITKLDPKTPISDLKIPLLNLQLNESDQQMKKEYEEVVRWLLLNSKKTCGQEAMRTKGNNESYSLISRLEPHPAIHLVNRRDLLLKRQKEGIFQLLALEDLQALLIPKKLDIL
jgi:hypothetical protein